MPRNLTLDDAAAVLRNEDKEALVRMMLECAREDERIHDRLILLAARRSGSEPGIAMARRAFEQAVEVRHFVSYHAARGWARDVEEAINGFEQLLEDGHAAAVMELCEWALRMLLDAIERVDDSDGHFGNLRDRLEALHFRACEAANPDSAELAARLFEMEMHCSFDIFHKAAARYAKILGPEGLEAYRQLAEPEWAKVPKRTRREQRNEAGQYFAITQIMESLAEAAGDADQVAAVMSHDLTLAYGYWKIGQVYREAGMRDKALQWAEDGLRAFPDHTDVRLREFAAEEYHERGRHEDAIKLMWAAFTERMYLEGYKTLRRHAEMANAWPEWRERALAEVRRRSSAADRSLLVEILLEEGKAREAWREAQEGGCSSRLWLALAETREAEYPEDAAPVYWKAAEAAIAEVRNGRYEDPVNLLVRAAALMKRMGRCEEFALQVGGLGARYKAKRNLTKLIEQKRKALGL